MKQTMRVLAILPVLVLAADARAAGFYLGEQDAVANGRGLAVTAKLREPSTLFFNPAGLAWLKGLQVSLGGSLVVAPAGYADPAGKRASARVTTEVNLAPHIYASYTFGEKWSIGLGMNSAFGQRLKWPTGFAGESISAGVDLKIPQVFLGAAYRPIPRLAFGVTLRVCPASVELLRRYQLVSDAGVTDWGYAHLAGSAVGVGASLGVMANPVDRLHLGFTYLSRVRFDFKNGVAHFGVPAGMSDTSVFHDQAGTTALTTPDVLSFGIGYDVSDAFYLEFDVNYTLWSVYKDLTIRFAKDPSGLLSKPVRKDWKDTASFRLGGEYRFLQDRFAVRLAVMYDQSPAPDATVGPEAPDVSRFVLGAGFGYRYKPLGLKADIGYTFVPPQKRVVTADDGNPFPARYDFSAHIVALTVGLAAF